MMLNSEEIRLYVGGLIGGVIGYRLFRTNPMKSIPISIIGLVVGSLAPFMGMVALMGYGLIVVTSRALDDLVLTLDEHDPILDEPFYVRHFQYNDE